MRRPVGVIRVLTIVSSTIACAVCLGLFAAHHYLYGQSEGAGFPERFDAVQAAPASHKVVFENAFVRVLQVTLPPKGTTEPMHHHRWPSLFLGYDTGGTTPHIRYHTPGGKVVDQPGRTVPHHPGVWGGHWMNPEPMHAIEVVDPGDPPSGGPMGWLRVEIKCAQ
jgi:hypothetical protein